MNLPDEINTIDEFIEVTTAVKKSTFTAQVYSVSSEQQVKEHLTSAKKKYYNASHHCYAYKLVDGITRYSDAGEPRGTAGIRILQAIEHFNLMNQLLVVLRIFGGIKLGVGPLGKAYYDSAYQALTTSKIKVKELFNKAIILSEFEHVSSIHRILAGHKSVILKSDYKEKLEISCLIKPGEIEQIRKKLIETAKNQIKITLLQDFIYK
jgi:uncharacterized YigZ family protein